MNAVNATEITAFLAELAALAAATVLPYFRTPVHIDDKGGARFDPVTIADRAAEQVLRKTIRARFPTHGVIGEEFGETPGHSAYVWVIDPIDGTRSFVSGLPTWGTLIALCEDARPRFGLMSQPYVGEYFVGGDGIARWHRGNSSTALFTRGTQDLSAASLFATTPDMFVSAFEQAAFAQLSGRVRMTRFGADCYAYCMLAAGHVDLVVEASLGFYDISALIPIVEVAGGLVTVWDGAPVRGGGRVIAAANAVIHAQALVMLNQAPA